MCWQVYDYHVLPKMNVSVPPFSLKHQLETHLHEYQRDRGSRGSSSSVSVSGWTRALSTVDRVKWLLSHYRYRSSRLIYNQGHLLQLKKLPSSIGTGKWNRMKQHITHCVPFGDRETQEKERGRSKILQYPWVSYTVCTWTSVRGCVFIYYSVQSNEKFIIRTSVSLSLSPSLHENAIAQCACSVCNSLRLLTSLSSLAAASTATAARVNFVIIVMIHVQMV